MAKKYLYYEKLYRDNLDKIKRLESLRNNSQEMKKIKAILMHNPDAKI